MWWPVVWGWGTVAAYADLSMMTGGCGVCVEACLVLGRDCLSSGDDASCTESVIVVTSTVATLG